MYVIQDCVSRTLNFEVPCAPEAGCKLHAGRDWTVGAQGSGIRGNRVSTRRHDSYLILLFLHHVALEMNGNVCLVPSMVVYPCSPQRSRLQQRDAPGLDPMRASRHVNFESLTRADQRKACSRSWGGRSKDEAHENPLQFVVWTKEQGFDTLMREVVVLPSAREWTGACSSSPGQTDEPAKKMRMG
ncbi:hypothetical protein BDP81DRAFT_427040 [Colletotrichum phormii]|uniref:Uncharacterized protein n=1 Tax=Colletotrichum phormii TaxID=359342 RepID=A0AAJ0EHP5_9PEZI|nr:uncharacterized protein BDP81DRAFT_427040 [Colletotrichum phormii]KAK1637256.1 hypothetical protein BDP81DRAFT_427040 [Colletotrichum phormii]